MSAMKFCARVFVCMLVGFSLVSCGKDKSSKSDDSDSSEKAQWSIEGRWKLAAQGCTLTKIQNGIKLDKGESQFLEMKSGQFAFELNTEGKQNKSFGQYEISGVDLKLHFTLPVRTLNFTVIDMGSSEMDMSRLIESTLDACPVGEKLKEIYLRQ